MLAKKHDEDEKIDELIAKVKKKGRKGLARVVYGRTVMYILLLLLQILFLYLAIIRYEKYTVSFIYGSGIMSFIVILLVINEEMNPMYKLAWIIPLTLAPIFGTVTYLFIRFQPGPALMRKQMGKIQKKITPYLMQDERVMENVAKESRDLCSTAKYLGHTISFPVYDRCETEYFPVGEKAFRSMLKELDKAEKFIFIEYFIIEDGLMWNAVLEILKEKAKKGVEVRVMYDGTCCFKLLPYSYPQQLKEMGIKAKIFSPIVPILSIHQNNRDHRKIMVIDGRVAFTGGVNLADEYINEVKRYGHWKDTAVMIKGQAVKSFTAMFLELWNIDKKAENEEVSEYFPDCPAESAGGYVIPYGDTPLDKENTGQQVYIDILSQADRYVYIMTPYLILDGEITNALKTTAKRGVDVRIIMPHIPDKKYAFYLARSYYVELMKAGVKIYEYKPGFVHAKQFVSDDSKAVVGSINLDYRSLFLHFECGLYMYGTDSVKDIKEDFDHTFEKCFRMDEKYYYNINIVKRIIGRVLRLIAPLM